MKFAPISPFCYRLALKVVGSLSVQHEPWRRYMVFFLTTRSLMPVTSSKVARKKEFRKLFPRTKVGTIHMSMARIRKCEDGSGSIQTTFAETR